MSRLAVSVMTAILLTLGGTQTAVAAQPVSSEVTASSSAGGEIALASPAQYQAILKAEGLTQNESGTIKVDKPITITNELTDSSPDATTAAEPDQTWWVVRTYKDKTGTSVPLRSGTSKWGYGKISVKHNIQSLNLIGAAISKGDKNTSRGKENPTWVGVTYYTNKPEVSETIIVGAYMGRVGMPTPITGVQGVLTAYCEARQSAPPGSTVSARRFLHCSGRACS